MKAFHPTADVIAASENIYGERLVTFEVEFHRFVLAELNTHRSLSRSYQSSRAVPVERCLDLVANTPAIPLHWGKNQAGMSADEECTSLIGGCEMYPGSTADEYWLETAKILSDRAREMHLAGYHKQVVNRLIETFMPIKGVLTGTVQAWEAFLLLRDHPAAQPEIRALAIEIKNKLLNIKYDKLAEYEWHLPYIGNNSGLPLSDAIITSVSCGAQVSYRRLDDSLEKARTVLSRLDLPENGVFGDDPPHFSAAEHCAASVHSGAKGDISRCGNFHATHFYQYRKMLENGTEGLYNGQEVK